MALRQPAKKSQFRRKKNKTKHITEHVSTKHYKKTDKDPIKSS